MIIKELDPFTGTDKFQVAGRQAEEQMSFYLRRYFADADDIYVINDLKLGKDGESLQIDHLVIYQYGLFIIESKSVSEKIIITKDHQWIRKYRDSSSGMKSPIIQAEMQKMLLASIIKELRSKHSCYFPLHSIDFLISISDSGIIEWPDNNPIEGVYKSDQICKKIKQHIDNLQKKIFKKIADSEIQNWIQKNISDKQFTDIRELFGEDSIALPRGNYPQWVAEFFCECHEAHMNFRKNSIPKILQDDLGNEIIQEAIKHDGILNKIIFENYTYALIWRKVFNPRNDPFLTAINLAKRRYLNFSGIKLATPIRRSKI